MIKVILYSDMYGGIEVGGDTIELIKPERVPSVEEITAADLLVVIGQLQNADAALELAGRIVLALEAGATVVFCYTAGFSGAEERIFPNIVPHVIWQQLSGNVSAIALDPEPHPVFRKYLVQYGQTAQGFRHVGPDSEVLAAAYWPGGSEMLPVAFVSSAIGTGGLYVLPIHLASDAADAFHALVEAVLEHRDEAADEVPAFLDALALPGEAERAAEIAEVVAKLEEFAAAQHALVRHKMLLSHMAGTPFEHLVIEELNLVLEGASLSARDTIERYVEDFEIVDEALVAMAIGEAKAVGKNVGFEHIDQLHRHRAELLAPPEEDDSEPDRLPTDTPGFLVVNIFRNDEELGRRQGERVHDRVAKYARQMNVLVLRSADLFQLVVRRLDGHNDADALAEMIVGSGGGWLEVADAPILHHG